LGIQRSFHIVETSVLDFRVEFFNFTNTPKFGQPLNDFAACTPLQNPSQPTQCTGPFGVIFSSAGNPRIVQAALKYRF